MDIKMVSVDSSNIDEIGYDDKSRTLRILFCSGALWDYSGVPASEHADIVASSSKGKYFNSEIRGVYTGKRVN
jgi:hypothetical protein